MKKNVHVFRLAVSALAVVLGAAIAGQVLADDAAPMTHKEKKAAKAQQKADKKSDIAQAKADKEKTKAQGDANEKDADAKLDAAKKQ